MNTRSTGFWHFSAVVGGWWQFGGTLSGHPSVILLLIVVSLYFLSSNLFP